VCPYIYIYYGEDEEDFQRKNDAPYINIVVIPVFYRECLRERERERDIFFSRL